MIFIFIAPAHTNFFQCFACKTKNYVGLALFILKWSDWQRFLKLDASKAFQMMDNVK